MAIVSWIILFLLSAWLLVSLFICAYWFFRPGDLFWTEHKYISTAIGIGAFLACGVIVTTGVERLLLFIPENWVYETEEGDLRLVRYSVAALIGVIAAFFLGALFDKVEKLRRENRNVSTELEIVRKIARRKEDLELDLLERTELEQAATEFKLRLDKLDELAAEDRLTRPQEVERRVLLGLVEELEKRMQNT